LPRPKPNLGLRREPPQRPSFRTQKRPFWREELQSLYPHERGRDLFETKKKLNHQGDRWVHDVALMTREKVKKNKGRQQKRIRTKIGEKDVGLYQ